MNRRLSTHLAALHFPPTESSRDNLLREGVGADRICVTGNTVIDALFEVVARIREDKSLEKSLAGRFTFLESEKKLILVTGHRRESFGDGF